LTPYRSWQDVVRQPSPIKESTPFQSNSEGKRPLLQAGLNDEKPYIPVSSDSDGYNPDVPAKSSGRKRKLTATSIQPRGTGVRDVTKVKHEEPSIKIEDTAIKEESNHIKLEPQRIKSKDDDSEEKFWDFTLSGSESDYEPDGVTVFDVVAGRIGNEGFLEDQELEEPLSVGQYLARRQAEVAPEQEHRQFGAHLQSRHALPPSDLLKAIHTHASDYYGMMEDSEDDFQSMDETALICMGILMEESAREILGETGFSPFIEQRPRWEGDHDRDPWKIKKVMVKDEPDVKEESHVDVDAKVKTERTSAEVRVQPKIEPGPSTGHPLKAERGPSDIDMNDIEEYWQRVTQPRERQRFSQQGEEPRQEKQTASRQEVIPQEHPLPESQPQEPPRRQQVGQQQEKPRQEGHQQAGQQHTTPQQGYHSDVSSWISQTFQHPQDDPATGPSSYGPP
jgi:hypothetical protein